MDETLRFLTRCEAPSTSTKGWPGLKISDAKIIGVSLETTVPLRNDHSCMFVTEALLKFDGGGNNNALSKERRSETGGHARDLGGRERATEKGRGREGRRQTL